MALPQPPMLERSQSTASLPHGYLRPSVPRAAFSHSASVGKRFPTKEQNAFACAHTTQPAGSSGVEQSHEHVGSAHALASTQAAYSSCVTSFRSISNALSETVWSGFSSGRHWLSTAALHPIEKSDPGTETMSPGWALPLHV